MIKKALFSLLVLSFLVAPLALNAQSADDIAKLVAKLEQQIAYLKQQLAQLQGQQGQQLWCFAFEKNLGVGSGGKAVDALHTILVKEGFTISPLPVSASIGTSYEIEFKKSKVTFTEATAAAVSGFQLKYAKEILAPLGLANPTGYVGPATRAVLNRLYGCKKPIIDDDDRPIPIPPKISDLRVDSPNGGEAWQKGTTQRIGWSWKTDVFVGQQFEIYLTPVNWSPTNPQLVIATGISGTSYYDWAVGKAKNLVTGENVAPSQSYYVAICAPSNFGGRVCDQSDSYFKIYDGGIPTCPTTGCITVISPNGGESWFIGQNQTIKWKYQSLIGSVHMFLVSSDNNRFPDSDDCHIGSAPVGQQDFSFTLLNSGPCLGYNSGRAIPSGTYKIWMYADNGNSDPSTWINKDQSDSYFKIYDSDQSGNKPPTISGVSGPTTLKIGETGTWTVQASDPENGPLSYSVVWGDEQMISGGVAAPTMEKVQQTATFTHSYATAGTYYPKFKVTDDKGQSNSTSLSVVVGSGVNPPALSSIQVWSPNGGESWQKGTTQRIGWNWKTDAHVGQQFAIYLTPVNWSPTNPQLVIATGIAGTSYYDWEVGKAKNLVTGENVAPSQSYYVAICAPSNFGGRVCDQSDSYFKIYDSDQTDNQPPIINGFAVIPETIKVGERVNFTWNALDPNGDNLSWDINWGDNTGAKSICPSPVPYTTYTTSHIWSQAGSYTVKVGVSDCRGGEDSRSMQFPVYNVPPPVPTITSSYPPNGAIDARSVSGFKDIVLNFSASGFDTGVKITSTNSTPISLIGTPYLTGATQFQVSLSRSLIAGERVTITHSTSGSKVCLGFLPGDVDQSGMVAPADILEMVDIMNGKNVPLYVGDVDRSGVIAPADQLAFTDLLNATNGKTLPACPAL